MKPKRKFLGWGLFCGVYWGSAKKAWQFEPVVGICATSQEAIDGRTDHCLSREQRRIYDSTMLNVGHHSRPDFVRADKWLGEKEQAKKV